MIDPPNTILSPSRARYGHPLKTWTTVMPAVLEDVPGPSIGPTIGICHAADQAEVA